MTGQNNDQQHDEGTTCEPENSFTCCICGETFVSPTINGYRTTIGQRNPWPIIDNDEDYGGSDLHCCGDCDGMYVLYARMHSDEPDALHHLADVMAANGCTAESVASVRRLARKAIREHLRLMRREGAIA